MGKRLEELAGQLGKQAAAVKELQARLAKNSRNSSKPPSSDGYGKPKRTESLRKPGQKPNGGQPGHEGQTLKRSEQPDRIEIHAAGDCLQCAASLAGVVAVAHEDRQVFDIPAMRIEVTAHRAEVKVCPECGAENRGCFPVGVAGPVQYGNGVKTWAAYFQNQHFVPVARTAQIFEDLLWLWGLRPWPVQRAPPAGIAVGRKGVWPALGGGDGRPPGGNQGCRGGGPGRRRGGVARRIVGGLWAAL